MLNAVNHKISLAYAAEHLKEINWRDIYVWLNTKFFDFEGVVEYAKAVIGDVPAHEETLVELLLLPPIEVEVGLLVKEHVAKLVKDVDEADHEKSLDKISYLVFNWLYENKEKFKVPLGVVWLVIEDFDYPGTLLDVFVYENEEDAITFQRWEKYLRDEAERWGKV